MKSIFMFSLCIATLITVACSKSKGDNDILIPDTPRSEVPDELTGKWLNGTFSMSNWWSYDGKNYVGNPYSRSTAFTFLKNGEAEFFQVIKTFNGTCATEGFSYFKGTVKFNTADHSLTFYPQKGNFRGFYSCAGSSNFNRAAKKEELNPITVYWTRETDTNNQVWMVTSFRADAPDSEKTYFKSSNW
jgi:hypothetical protein